MSAESEDTAGDDAARDEETQEGAATAGIALVPAKHDFGLFLEGQARSRPFAIRRPLGTALKIGRLYSPCPCIRVRTRKVDVPAGEDAEVTVRLHSLTLEGEKSFPFYVELLEPASPSGEKLVLRADVSAEVERVPAKLHLEPRAFHLGTVTGAKSARVRLDNLTRYPVSLGELACSLEGVQVGVRAGPGDGECRRIEPGASATLALDVPERALPPGPVRGTVTLETNVPEHAQLAIPIDGTVRAP
jgi:hypothetical protein